MAFDNSTIAPQHPSQREQEAFIEDVLSVDTEYRRPQLPILPLLLKAADGHISRVVHGRPERTRFTDMPVAILRSSIGIVDDAEMR